jgi:DNA-binding Lrp family transcriptional regulator
MQWPGDDALDLWPEIDSRRPTAYWIYQKIRAKESEFGEEIYSKNSVIKHYECVMNCLSPKFIIAPSLFSYSMESLLFVDDVFLSGKQLMQIQKIPNIEELQRGIGLWQFGLLPILAVNVLFREKEELEKVIEKITEISDSLRLVYRLKSFMFSPKSGYELSSLINKNGTMRPVEQKLIECLVENPLIPLNDLSKKTGISRDKVYLAYANLSKSGLFKIEYSMTTPVIAGLSFLQTGFSVENSQKKALISKLRNLPIFADRFLLSRWSFDNIIYTLFWVRDYVDFLNIHSSLMRYMGDESVVFSVWQPRSYLNKSPWLEMINSKSFHCLPPISP